MSKLAHAGASSTTPSFGASSYARRTAPSSVAACSTGTAPSNALTISGVASPIATTFASRDPQRFAQQRKISALETSAHDHDEPAIEALNRPLRGLDVCRLRIVDESDAADDGDRLECVLEAGERFHRAHDRVVRYAGDLRDGRRGHHVGDQMLADEAYR